MIDAVALAFANFANFSDRASRSEFWFFQLFVVVGIIALSFVDGATGTPVSMLFSLAVVIPSISVTVRRLHDTGRSGWWYFISFIPLIGIIWLIVLLASSGDANANEYGPAPF